MPDELPRNGVTARETIEFAMVWVFVHAMRLLPRRLARAIGSGIGALAFYGLGRLRRVGMQNLGLAFPEKTTQERERILQIGVPESWVFAG